MPAVTTFGPGDVRAERCDDAKIVRPTDAVIRTVATCVCGSDLWPYRGVHTVTEPARIGHEYVGDGAVGLCGVSAAKELRIGRPDGSLDALSNQSGDFTAKVELSR